LDRFAIDQNYSQFCYGVNPSVLPDRAEMVVAGQRPYAYRVETFGRASGTVERPCHNRGYVPRLEKLRPMRSRDAASVNRSDFIAS
jgi:hypothetical protein